jgi:hypothetical protein
LASGTGSTSRRCRSGCRASERSDLHRSVSSVEAGDGTVAEDYHAS